MADTHLTHTVEKSFEKLVKKFEGLSEKGKTALGPGLTVSLGMISKQKKGSMIVICTDGLANVGIGALDNDIELESLKISTKMWAISLRKVEL